MPKRTILLLLWAMFAALAQARPAQAVPVPPAPAPPWQEEVVKLRSDVCYATSPANAASDARTVSALRFDCRTTPSYDTYADRWVWVKVRDPKVLASLQAGWTLLIDQVRFDQLVTLVVARDGSVQRQSAAPGALGYHPALGGVLRFTSRRPGADVSAVYVGFLRMDHLSLMRKISAASPTSSINLDRLWLGLMGVFVGAILSAFVYNFLIYTGQRLLFQRWYLVWSALALCYGLTWTNMFWFALPALAGPVAVDVDYLLVAALISTANMFFFSVIEEGVLPKRLIRCGHVVAALTMFVGFVAWSNRVGEPIVVDRLLNIVFVASALCLAIGVGFALRARSRVVWFYLIGWAPVLLVFVFRVSRNFGLTVQDDFIDMSTFAALAFEAVALSLAIADRFRMLRHERDAAEQARRVVEVESETYRRAAQTDYLTGLGNRAAFQAKLKTLCEAQERAPFALLLVDVDHLKDINDRLGHDGGDVLLGSVGRGLATVAGDYAQVARIGGDEFAIIIHGDEQRLAEAAAALEELQGHKLNHAGRSWSLSLSIGVARFPEDADTADVLVKNADLALYHAKQNGRRRFHRFDGSLRANFDSRQLLSQEARSGLERDEFSLHYQPIIDLRTGAVCSHEALLRWQHPERGQITPTVFGDILDDRKGGLAVQQHVLEMALHAMRMYPAALPRLSVNFTAAQLDGENAAGRLLTRMQDEGVEPGRLCIEVTEDIVLTGKVDRVADALAPLHEAGVAIALDDFGTGYASLIHLKQLPFDVLKIDRSFTLALFEDDGQSEEIVRAIIGLAHGLRKQVVAEGIETEAQRERLAAMGCHFGQGYLFARPQPIEVIAQATPDRAGASTTLWVA